MRFTNGRGAVDVVEAENAWEAAKGGRIEHEAFARELSTTLEHSMRLWKF
jgi:hypothetical protein